MYGKVLALGKGFSKPEMEGFFVLRGVDVETPISM
jgi:hypothetical protein